MTWGIELWDQFDQISHHTQRGLDFLEKFCQFIKDRCTIEMEYATKLRRLCKNYQPKKKEEEDYQLDTGFTSLHSFILMLNEVNDMAGQHELVSENMQTQIVKEISVLLKELKDERKKHLHEGSKLQNNLNASLALLDKSKKAYEKAYREAEKAQDAFNKADQDYNLSRADVGKAKQISVSKTQICEDCKTDYANQLQKTNELQRVHYTDLMPKVFQQLQEVDERRISCIQNFVKQKADIQRNVIPIINQCLDGIVKSAECVDCKADSQVVIERYKSGFPIPEDYPFEDLSAIRINDNSSTITSYPTLRNDTIKGTLSTGKLKKRTGIFGLFSTTKNHVDESKEDFSDQPPVQRKKKLQLRIDEIKAQITTKMGTREGLIKMKDCYEKNPALGDLDSVEAQLSENAIMLDKLQNELAKYQGFLDNVDLKPHTPNVNKRDRNSISEESLSRSASDSSVCNPNNNNKPSAPGTPLPAHGSSNSPESGIGMSHTSIPDADADVDQTIDEEYQNNGEVHQDFDEPLPVLGTARALYAFEAQSEGSIPMYEGEDFDVVELDQGDGWTRVRKNNGEEGFVPTTYIECHLYNSC